MGHIWLGGLPAVNKADRYRAKLAKKEAKIARAEQRQLLRAERIAAGIKGPEMAEPVDDQHG